MDTKWNNIISQIQHFVVKRKQLLTGIITTAIGISIAFCTLIYSWRYTYLETLFFGILANGFIGVGIVLSLKDNFEKKYGLWIPENDLFYQEWKKEYFNQKKRVWIWAVVLLAAAFLSDLYIGCYNFPITTYTIFIQFIVCQTYISRYMNKKLDKLMEAIKEINKRSLDTALEIERQSLEKVTRSDQLRLDLITNVSHDLKTPLTSMVGYLELIKKEELSEVVRDYIEVIVDKTDKLKEMIESLFSLAKVSSGNVNLHMEKFQLNRLIEQIMADMKDQIDESGLHFVVRLTEENTEIMSDNIYCYRICQNLLENVLKYSAKGTRVFIKTYSKDNNELCIEMTNTSAYFMDFEKEEILEKFARGDKSRSTEGNGLGLAIVSSYAKALGGEFDIQIDCDQFKACLVLPK